MILITSSHVRRPVFTLVGVIIILNFYHVHATGGDKDDNPDSGKQSQHPNLLGYQSSDKKPPYADYNSDPGQWANLKMVSKAYNLTKLSNLCVTGTFLVYGKPDYAVANPEKPEIKLISGKGSCIPAGNFSSMQLVMPTSSVANEASVAFFVHPYLQGAATTFKKSLREWETRIPGHVHSILMHGDTPYTVISAKTGIHYCLQPGSKGKKAPKNSICLKMQITGKDNIFSDAFRSCTSSNVKSNRTFDIFLEDCRPYGAGILEQLKTPPPEKKTAPPPELLNVKPKNKTKNDLSAYRIAPNYPPPISKCNENGDFLELMDMRVKSNFDSPFQLFYPKDKSHAWRTELLDNAFDIAMKVCPDGIVSREFLQVLREFYIFLAEKLVWGAKKKGPKDSKGATGLPQNASLDYQVMVDMTQSCSELLQPGEIMKHVSVMDNLDHHRIPYDPRLEPFAALSPVMEVVWLIFNTVASVCHKAFEFQNNFWLDFVPLFYETYIDLEGLKTEWKKPGLYSGFLTYLFGGGPYIQNLEQLAICASSGFTMLPNLQIISRPEGFPQPQSYKD